MLWWTLRQLQSKNWQTRIRAAQELGNLRDPRTIDPLIASLETHPFPGKEIHRKFVKEVITALGNIADVRAVKTLVEHLGYRELDVMKAAVEGLARIGPSAVSELGRALKDGHMPVWVSQALVKIGAPAVEPVLETLKGGDSSIGGINVRETATKALAQIGDARAIEGLVEALNDRDIDVRRAAAAGLKSLDWQPTDAQQVQYFIGCGEWNKVASLGETAVEPLLNSLASGNYYYTSEVVQTLGKIGDVRAFEPLVLLLDGFRSQGGGLAVGGDFLQVVIDALRKFGGARAVGPLIRIVRSYENEAHGIVGTIKALLVESAPTIAPEDLRMAATLDSVKQRVGPGLHWDPVTKSTLELSYGGTVSVDCSQVRQLAQQELIRRGLEV